MTNFRSFYRIQSGVWVAAFAFVLGLTRAAPAQDDGIVPGIGKPSAQKASALPIQKWAKDGGGRETIKAPEGQAYLVISFAPQGEPAPIKYLSTEYKLMLEGAAAPLSPQGVTSTIANMLKPGQTSAPPVYQLEMYMCDYTPRPDAPFGVVFLVPADSSKGTLSVKEIQIPLQW